MVGCQAPEVAEPARVFVSVTALRALHPAAQMIGREIVVAGASPASRRTVDEPGAPEEVRLPSAPGAKPVALPDRQRAVDRAKNEIAFDLAPERALAVLPADEALAVELARLRASLAEVALPDLDAARDRYLKSIDKVLTAAAKLRARLETLRPNPKVDRFFFTQAQQERRALAYQQLEAELKDLETRLLPELAQQLNPQSAAAPQLDAKRERKLRSQRELAAAKALREAEARVELIASRVVPAPPPPVFVGPEAPPAVSAEARERLAQRQTQLAEEESPPPAGGPGAAGRESRAESNSRKRLWRHVDEELRALVTRLGQRRSPSVIVVFERTGADLRDATASFLPAVRRHYSVGPRSETQDLGAALR